MTNIQRLRVKLGNAEFEAEGDADSVKQQFAEFMLAIASGGAGKKPVDVKADVEGQIAQCEPQPKSLDKIFKTGELISLLALPKTDAPSADALLLLIYGFEKLKGESTVGGNALMQAARQSGVPIPRVDRVIAARDEFYNAAGAKKGRRYSLNNKGSQHVERMIAELLD